MLTRARSPMFTRYPPSKEPQAVEQVQYRMAEPGTKKASDADRECGRLEIELADRSSDGTTPRPELEAQDRLFSHDLSEASLLKQSFGGMVPQIFPIFCLLFRSTLLEQSLFEL